MITERHTNITHVIPKLISESDNGKVRKTGGVGGKNANVSNTIPKQIYIPNFIRIGQWTRVQIWGRRQNSGRGGPNRTKIDNQFT